MNNKKEKTDFLFTSEFVTEGHPDKLCDIISDAILDAHLKEDPKSRVACETAIKNKKVFVFGEITSKAEVNISEIVKSTIKEIGHFENQIDDLKIDIEINKQSPEISNSLHTEAVSEELGAGDQGMMFGYASDESAELMPLSLILSRKLCHKLTELRKSGAIPWLLPDGKSQVTLEYKQRLNSDSTTNNKNRIKKGMILEPVRCHTIVLSTQHRESVTLEEIRATIENEVVRKVVPEKLLDSKTRLLLNYTGSFHIGGSEADAGLTGRKIIVDGYGGWGSHGGGAFSGKDATKVDRSGAYFARFIAKSLVANKLCKRVLVQISYCIGFAKPLSVYVETYGTGAVCDRELENLVKEKFDLRPGKMIEKLNLRNPRFKEAAQFGHFGWDDGRFSWEVPCKLEGVLKSKDINSDNKNGE